jgi:hypothetical protein
LQGDVDGARAVHDAHRGAGQGYLDDVEGATIADEQPAVCPVAGEIEAYAYDTSTI